MVERELFLAADRLGDGHQPSVCGVAPSCELTNVPKNSQEADGHDVHPRVAPWVAVRTELAQVVGRLDAGLLPQLP